VIKKMMRKAGAVTCIGLVLFTSLPPGVLIGLARASSAQPVVQASVATTAPQIGNISAQSFLQNPALLFNAGNITQVGQNVVSLIGQGVTTGAINSAISQFGGSALQAAGFSASAAQGLTSVVSSIATGQNINPAAAASMLNSVAQGVLPANLAQGLAQVANLGNITSISGLVNTLTSGVVKTAMNGLSALAQGTGLDKILQIATAGLNPAQIAQMATSAGISALTNAISSVAPQLAGALGNALGGAVQGAMNAIAGAAGAAAGAAVGAAVGALAGGLGSAAAAALGGAGGGGGCSFSCSDECKHCQTAIPAHHESIRGHITAEFQTHRGWLVTTFWQENMLPAMMLMAEQLSVAGIKQVEMFGALLDAKHQLETQRLFQQMTAEAHKDYQPSEGMCTFGTTVRSLAASERKTNITQVALSQRMMQRQAISGDVVSVEGADSDIRSRLKNYIENYCDKADNANGLSDLCQSAPPKPERRNIDVDFTRNIESRLTLDVNFAPESGASSFTDDEKDVFALSANLFSHNIAPKIEAGLLASQDKKIRLSAVEKYMDLRSIFAKRSVAQNSFAALTSLRAAGTPESAPYTKAIMKELGITDTKEIEKMLGKDPSYFAQMEILTKKIYQSPLFYTDLYDKPANIERKGAALQAIALMQDRDLYNSLLRSEVVLSVLLETMLQREQERIASAIPKSSAAGGGR
jgi:hypothetical protein